MASRLIPFHVPFFDDYLRGVFTHDLVLLGAESGVGKTDLAATIARRTAETGRTVHYFALEAEPREIERRTKYGMISRWMVDRGYSGLDRLNYVDWYLDRLGSVVGDLDREADEEYAVRYKTLHTYYKQREFVAAELKRLLVAHQTASDLFVVDHLHYVDIDDDNETRGQRDLIKTIRDAALGAGKPVLLVVHLRKASTGRKEPLVPDLDRVHGSSDIAKIATRALMLSRAPFPGRAWYYAPTFLSVPKDRMGGACRMVAMSNYDIRTRSYESDYTLGRLEDGGTKWSEISPEKCPPWATHFAYRNGVSTDQAAPK